jgi:hypothetical protein
MGAAHEYRHGLFLVRIAGASIQIEHRLAGAEP